LSRRKAVTRDGKANAELDLIRIKAHRLVSPLADTYTLANADPRL
jgi:hypothetical protein